MASDRGSAPDLHRRELDESWFDCDVLHLSGYSLLREPIASPRSGGGLARAHGAQVSVDVSTWTLVDEAFRARVREIAPDVRFRDRARAGGRGRARDALGAEAWRNGIVRGRREHPALSTDVVDTTGAGDALAAGFLIGGAELGLRAAARCCAQMGAMP